MNHCYSVPELCEMFWFKKLVNWKWKREMPTTGTHISLITTSVSHPGLYRALVHPIYFVSKLVTCLWSIPKNNHRRHPVVPPIELVHVCACLCCLPEKRSVMDPFSEAVKEEIFHHLTAYFNPENADLLWCKRVQCTWLQDNAEQPHSFEGTLFWDNTTHWMQQAISFLLQLHALVQVRGQEATQSPLNRELKRVPP